MATLPMGRRPACNSTSAFLSSMSTSPPIFSRRISLERVRILNPPAAFSTRKSPGSIFISPGSEPICRLVREELKRTSLPTLVRLTSLKKSPSSETVPLTSWISASLARPERLKSPVSLCTAKSPWLMVTLALPAICSRKMSPWAPFTRTSPSRPLILISPWLEARFIAALRGR